MFITFFACYSFFAPHFPSVIINLSEIHPLEVLLEDISWFQMLFLPENVLVFILPLFLQGYFFE
jgi:hypothetical protein